MAKDNVIDFDMANEKKEYNFDAENLHEVLGVTEQELEQIVQKMMKEFSTMYENTETKGYQNVYAAFKLFLDEERPFVERFALFSAVMLQLNECVEIKQAVSLIFALTAKPMVDRQMIGLMREMGNIKGAIQQAIDESKNKIVTP